MKKTMKKITAIMIAMMIMIQLVPAYGVIYSSGTIVGSPDGFKEPMEIVASKGTYVLLGQTLELDVNEDYIAIWKSGDESIATIDAKGVLTAVAPGTVTIIAESGRFTATAEITVLDPAPLMEEAAAEAQAEIEPETAAEPETEPVAETEPETEPAAETKPEAEPVTETEPDAEPVTETEPENEPETEPEPVSVPVNEVKPEQQTAVEQPVEKKLMVIVINGENGRAVFDGEEHTLDRFVATGNDDAFDPEKVSYTGELGVTGTDCGMYELNLESIQFSYDDPNVTAHFVVNNSWLKITPAHATVNADPAEKEAGQDDPELTATVTGVFGNDEIQYRISRAYGEEPGTYAITVEGEETQGNYRVEYNGSVLTITEPAEKVTIIITGEKTEVEYDGDVHENTYTVSSNQESFDETKLHLTEEGKMHLASGTDSGAYNDELTAEDFIYEGGEAEFVINNGSLQIIPATVTVQLGAFTKKWGEADPDFTEGMFVDGLRGDDTAETLNLQVVREEGEETGSYALTLAEKATGNYRLSVLDGTLLIEMPQVQIRSSMEGVTQAYAGTEVVLTAVMDGLDTERFSIQWQMGDTPDDDSMEDIEGANDPVYTYILDESTAGKYFRVLINLK